MTTWLYFAFLSSSNSFAVIELTRLWFTSPLITFTLWWVLTCLIMTIVIDAQLNNAMKVLSRQKRSLRESRFDKKGQDDEKSGIARRIFLLSKLLREIYFQSPSFCHDVTEKKALIFLNQLLGMLRSWIVMISLIWRYEHYLDQGQWNRSQLHLQD